MVPKFFRSSKGEISTFLILGIVIAGAFAFVGGFVPPKKFIPPSGGTAVVLQDINSNDSQKSLQLKTLGIITITPSPSTAPLPTPVTYCPHDNGQPIVNSGQPIDPNNTCNCGYWIITCQNKQCVKLISHNNNPIEEPYASSCTVPQVGFFISYTKETFDSWCRSYRLAPIDGTYCIGKPVIYLYPTKKTLVDVSVETSGNIVVSDPLYPTGGWKDVLAYPDGNLTYENKNYRELFYETNVTDIKKPDNGLLIEARDIEKTLKELNKRLGLTEFESKELSDFWVPKLKKISPYLLVSLIQGEEKERLDRLNINPSPDTLIEILYYFKPLDKPVKIPVLNLPDTPKRTGFTAVEWGGTIDFK